MQLVYTLYVYNIWSTISIWLNIIQIIIIVHTQIYWIVVYTHIYSITIALLYIKKYNSLLSLQKLLYQSIYANIGNTWLIITIIICDSLNRYLKITIVAMDRIIMYYYCHILCTTICESWKCFITCNWTHKYRFMRVHYNMFYMFYKFLFFLFLISTVINHSLSNKKKNNEE